MTQRQRFSSFPKVPDVFDCHGLRAHLPTVTFTSSDIYKIHVMHLVIYLCTFIAVSGCNLNYSCCYVMAVVYFTPVKWTVHADSVVDPILPLSVLVLLQSRPRDRELNLLLPIP